MQEGETFNKPEEHPLLAPGSVALYEPCGGTASERTIHQPLELPHIPGRDQAPEVAPIAGSGTIAEVTELSEDYPPDALCGASRRASRWFDPLNGGHSI
jgi:hypothetical protein